MAHAAPDFVIDKDENNGLLDRDDKWFRANASRSATPETQLREIDRAPVVYTNAPHRLGPSANQVAVDAAAAALFPHLFHPEPLEVIAARIVVPDLDLAQKVAMHGGAGVGERFMQPRRRLQPIKFASPEFGREACSETRREARRAPEVIVKSQGHAIALRAVERGVAERKSLDDLRAAAALRRAK